MTTPSTTSPALPFTIRGNAFFGFSYKVWLLPILLVFAASSTLVALFIPEYTLFVIPLLAVGLIAVGLLTFFSNKYNYVTLYADHIELSDWGKRYSVPLSELDRVRRGLEYAGGRDFVGLAFSSKARGVYVVTSSLYYTLKGMNALYSALPVQLQDDSDDVRKPIRL